MTFPPNPSLDINSFPRPAAGGPGALAISNMMPDVITAIIPNTGLYDSGANPLVVSPTVPGLLIYVKNNESVPVRVRSGFLDDPGVIVAANAAALLGVDPTGNTATSPCHILFLGGVGNTTVFPPEVFISASGNDANTGLTRSSPIRSQAGITRLLGLLPTFGTNFKLNFIGPGPYTDDLLLNWGVGRAIVQILGEDTTFASPPALDFVQPRDQPSNTPLLIGAGAFNWGPCVNKIAVIITSTNPANVGARASILKDDGAQAETSSWMVTDPQTLPLAPTEIVPLVGDVIEIVDSFSLTGNLAISVTGAWTDSPGVYKFFFRGFNINSDQSSVIKSNGLQSYIVDCMLSSRLFLQNITRIDLNETPGSQLTMNTSLSTGPFPLVGDIVYGGSSNGVDRVFTSPCNITLKNGFIVKDARMIVRGDGASVKIHDAVVRDWFDNTAAITVEDGSAEFSNADALSGTSPNPQTRVGDVFGGAQLINATGLKWANVCPCEGTESIQFAVVSNGVIDQLAPKFDHGSLTYTSLEKLTKDNLTVGGGVFEGTCLDPRTGALFVTR